MPFSFKAVTNAFRFHRIQTSKSYKRRIWVILSGLEMAFSILSCKGRRSCVLYLRQCRELALRNVSEMGTEIHSYAFRSDQTLDGFIFHVNHWMHLKRQMRFIDEKAKASWSASPALKCLIKSQIVTDEHKGENNFGRLLNISQKSDNEITPFFPLTVLTKSLLQRIISPKNSSACAPRSMISHNRITDAPRKPGHTPFEIASFLHG